MQVEELQPVPTLITQSSGNFDDFERDRLRVLRSRQNFLDDAVMDKKRMELTKATPLRRVEFVRPENVEEVTGAEEFVEQAFEDPEMWSMGIEEEPP